MAPHPSTQFVEAALSCGGGQFELSYADPDQKLQIKRDLLSLIQEFPNFALSMDSYTHNDGTAVNLICAIVNLRVSGGSSPPPVPITIWVHEDYPYVAPMLFVDSSRLDHDCPISCGHPFVDSSSGFIVSPYIHSWDFPRSNLRDLVRNLVHVFSLDHPLGSPTGSSSGPVHPSYVSKNEAVDRLAGMLHVDVKLARSEADEEVEGLLCLQRELAERAEDLASAVSSLKLEKRALRVRVRESWETADVLEEWLKVYEDRGGAAVEVEDSFEATDEESETRLWCEAGDKAVEETIYALDEAVSDGIVGFGDYMKQVRTLAREQFSYRAMLVKKLNQHQTHNTHGPRESPHWDGN